MKTVTTYLSNKWSLKTLQIFIWLTIMIIYSCQKADDYMSLKRSTEIQNSFPSPESKINILAGESSTLYFGHKIFKRGYGAPFIETLVIEGLNFDCYDDNFILKIKNGNDKKTSVTSAEILIDGTVIAYPSNFSKNVSDIIIPLSGLTSKSILEVKLMSAPGSFIDLWIEGTLNVTVPIFDTIGPLCQYSIAPELPLFSNNTLSVYGTWDPEVINTSVLGTTNYTFTPADNQCANSITMEIEVIADVIPIFDQVGPFIQNSIPTVLPETSKNGIKGVWTPKNINTSEQGTYIFTFTPTEGNCAIPVIMNVDIGGVFDVDNNIYKTIKIGDQWWMAENLKTSKYQNGDLIGTTSPLNLDISNVNEPKFQWSYNDNVNNSADFGKYYTWYVVNDDRGVCPIGWHVPSDTEWITLNDYLVNNGYGYQGSGADIAKSLAAKSGWKTDEKPGNIGTDVSLNNTSGFTALPGGIRVYSGTFNYLDIYAVWWSSSLVNTTLAWNRNLYSSTNYLRREMSKKNQGVAIRCVKDN